jgi:SAM-dependent methyltransferase
MSSYDPAATTARGLPGELDRLEAQAALSFDEELQVLCAAGLASAGPFLEVGAGSGAFARRLRTALPELRVVAADLDLRLLGHAGAPAVAGDAFRLPVRSGVLGGVLLRYVLQHLPDPGAALAEARRVLRPGGRLFVIEVDAAMWGLAEPAFPEVASVYTRLSAAQHGAGGDRQIGRKLTRLLRGAGFTGVTLRPFATTSDDRPVEDFAPHLGPARLAPLYASGDVSLAQLALAADRWKRFRADQAAWVMLLGFAVTGTNPPIKESIP